MNQRPILVVEDDEDLRDALQDTLTLAGYAVATAADGARALKLLESSDISMIVSDVQMQPMDGQELLKHVRARWPHLPMILMTAYGTIQKAVAAMQEGAANYLVKPFEAEALLNMVQRFLGAEKSEGDLVAVDQATRELAELARRVADSEATVMLSGESGTGKEVFARFIHRHSPRSRGPFVAINCAAIPENMLEAVLFGHEKGAFTGANSAHAGKFEQAQGGTLLLDEVSEMDLGLQAKLLRVLQEKEVERLGGRKPIALDVRVLATTNRKLREYVAAGQFREDLFYRLNVFPLELPALRKRPKDILPLAQYLLARYCAGTRAVPDISMAARQLLSSHPWPGNIRELDNLLQRTLILMSGGTIDADDFKFEGGREFVFEDDDAATGADSPKALQRDLRSREQQLILDALESADSRKDAAARLGISPRTLRYKIARLRESGIAVPA